MDTAPKVEGSTCGTSALSAGFGVFSIWRRGHFEDCWSRTSHSVTARTDKEAQAKVKRKFAGCGFSAMSLVAVKNGMTPNRY
jgi:hypothetical protein